MRKAELIFIPTPAAGHLISSVEISKLLLSRDERLNVTILLMKFPMDLGATDYAKTLMASNSNPRLNYIELPEEKSVSETLSTTKATYAFIDRQKKHVRTIVSEIANRPSSKIAGFIVDMFCTGMLDVADEFGLPTYMIFTSGAACLGLFFHLQSLKDDHGEDLTKYINSDVELAIPCLLNPLPCKLILPDVFGDREDPKSTTFLDISVRNFRKLKGIIVNTFSELETHAIQSLSFNEKVPKIYPVGPMQNFKEPGHGKNNNSQTESIMKWLDNQPDSSVVFLCFGSMGCFDEDQVKEIANALEKSGHRFLWSLRRAPPKGKIELPSEYEDFEEVLPEGFLERTAGIGKLIGWAPQIAVLSHPAVGGFVTHCGWNSILESLWCGVPMATWPLYAEQQMNAFLLVKDLRIAEEIRIDYRRDFKDEHPVELVPAEDIERGIRKLFSDEEERVELRKKVMDVKEKSRKALEEGGSSYATMNLLVEDIINFIA